MKITIHSTTKVVQLQTPQGVIPARIWEGTTERGTPVHAFVTRICPTIEKPVPGELAEEFERDLQECEAPTAAVQGIPLRLIL
jgi:hypothetical protein